LSKEKTTRGGKIKRADGSKHMPTSNALPHQQEKKMVAGAEFQTKQRNQRRWGQRQSQPSLLIWRARALEKNKQTNTSINIL